MEEPGRLVHVVVKSRTRLSDFSFFLSIVPFGKGNGNPLLPGESHGRRGLVGYSLWGCIELDTTKQLKHTHTQRYRLHSCIFGFILGFSSVICLFISFVLFFIDYLFLIIYRCFYIFWILILCSLTLLIVTFG